MEIESGARPGDVQVEFASCGSTVDARFCAELAADGGGEVCEGERAAGADVEGGRAEVGCALQGSGDGIGGVGDVEEVDAAVLFDGHGIAFEDGAREVVDGAGPFFLSVDSGEAQYGNVERVEARPLFTEKFSRSFFLSIGLEGGDWMLFVDGEIVRGEKVVHAHRGGEDQALYPGPTVGFEQIFGSLDVDLTGQLGVGTIRWLDGQMADAFQGMGEVIAGFEMQGSVAFEGFHAFTTVVPESDHFVAALEQGAAEVSADKAVGAGDHGFHRTENTDRSGCGKRGIEWREMPVVSMRMESRTIRCKSGQNRFFFLETDLRSFGKEAGCCLSRESRN